MSSNQFNSQIQKWIHDLSQLNYPPEQALLFQTRLLPGFMGTILFSERIGMSLMQEAIVHKKNLDTMLAFFLSKIEQLPKVWKRSFLSKGFREFLEFIRKTPENHLVFFQIIENLYFPKDSNGPSLRKFFTDITTQDVRHDTFGKIYELFLDEIRHNRGIYYTQASISAYIAKETLSAQFTRFLHQIKNAIDQDNQKKQQNLQNPQSHHLILTILDRIIDFKILDPACGSGSFLLQAFWVLIRYYQEIGTIISPILNRSKQKSLDPGIISFFGNSSLEMGQNIIRRHLHGIDKDSQAIDFTYINIWLALKAFCENPAGFPFQTEPSTTQICSDINFTANLVHGDTLIGLPNEDVLPLWSKVKNDFLQRCDTQFEMYLKTKKIPIKIITSSPPVYFPVEFPACYFDSSGNPKMQSEQGFDVIFGNPPYQRAATFVEWKKYYLARFHSIFGACDIFVPFIQQSLDNLKADGMLGMIVSNKLLLKDYAKKIRLQLYTNELIELMDLTPCHSIFEDALVAPLIFQVKKTPFLQTNHDHTVRIRLFQQDHPEYLISESSLLCPYTEEFRPQANLLNSQGHFALKISASFESLITKIYSGSTLYKELGSITTGLMGFDYEKVGHYVIDAQDSLEDDVIPFIPNGLIAPYKLLWGQKTTRLFKQQFQYPRLKMNPVVSKDAWIRYRSPKVLIRGVAKHLTSAFDPIGWAISVEVIGVQCSSLPITVQVALINSQLFNWLHMINYLHGRIPRGSLNYPKPFIEQLPMKNSTDFTTFVNDLVPKMEKMADSDKNKEKFQHLINEAVFRLYNLTSEEIDVIQQFMQTISH